MHSLTEKIKYLQLSNNKTLSSELDITEFTRLYSYNIVPLLLFKHTLRGLLINIPIECLSVIGIIKFKTLLGAKTGK